MKTYLHTMSPRSLMALVTMASAFALSACAVDAGDAMDDAEEEVGTAEEAIASGWTYTSDEYAPVSCDGSSLMSAAYCTGRYCDNVGVYCQPTSGTRPSLPAPWTPYFSEEQPAGQICDVGYWVTDIDCNGSYCDNLSLRCTYINNVAQTNCHWVGPVSEENGGTIYFDPGYFIRGARCTGSYCDNMEFYVCHI